MMMANHGSSSTTDRKTIERNRRNQMKALYSTLNSLVPLQRPAEATSLPDQLEEAANYIKRLQINLERMRERKDRLMGIERPAAASTSSGSMNSTSGGGAMAAGTTRLPQIEIHELGQALDVVLITGLDCKFLFIETIRLLHEEGVVDIVNASFNVVEDTIFHTIHSKIRDSASADSSARISERLKKFVQDASAF